MNDNRLYSIATVDRAVVSGMGVNLLVRKARVRFSAFMGENAWLACLEVQVI